VLIVRPEDFEQANGFSNEYWGWGSEDDDLYLRFKLAGVTVVHRPGRYLSLRHGRSLRPDANKDRFARMARTAVESGRLDPSTAEAISRFAAPVKGTDSWQDGLNNLHYHLVDRRPLASVTGASTVDDVHEVISIEF